MPKSGNYTKFLFSPLDTGAGNYIATQKQNNGQTNAEQAIYIEELEKVNEELRQARRAALNLMEDAILSREALSKSEEKYRTLFNSIDEGFVIQELVTDENENVTDLVYREANKAFEQHTGMKNAEGKKISEFVPHLEQHWLDALTQVYQTGEPLRGENYTADLNRWLTYQYLRIGGTGSRFIAAVFNDTTERKQREEQKEFLLKLSDVLRSVANPVELQHAAMKLLVEQLQVMRAGYYEVEADQESFGMTAGYEVDAVPMPKRMRLSDFSESLSAEYRSGKTQFLCDSEKEVNDENQEAYRALGIRAWAAVPLVKNGQLVAVVGVHAKTARNWTPVELKMLEDLAEQTWAAVERAKAEEALRRSEERLQLANEAADIGTFIYYPNEDRGEPDTKMLALYGLPQDGTLNLSEALNHIIHPDDRERYTNAVMQAINPESNGNLNEDIRIIHPDGSVHWMNVTAQTIFENGKAMRMPGVSVDITERKKAEGALRLNEQRLQRMVNIPKLGVLTFDYNENMLQANDAFLEMVGYSREDFEGKQFTWREFTPPEHMEASFRVIEQLEKTGVGGPYEKEYYRKDGSKVWMMFVAADMGDGTLVEYAIDISDRKRAEEALRTSETRLRALVENLPGAAVFVVDKNLRYLLAEGEALAEAGFKSEEFTGRTIYEALPPGLAESYEPQFQRALNGEPFETEHKAHNHTYISCGVPLTNATGEVYALLAISYDITDRKNAEEDLRQSEERLQTLADAVPQIIWTNNETGTANFFNQRWYEYSGLNFKEAIGKGWEAIVHPADAPNSKQKWQEALAAGEIFDTEYRLKRYDGVYRWFIGRNVPLKDNTGKITGWFGSATDIEDLKKAQEAVRISEERLKATMDSATEYAIITMNAERKIERWSCGAEEIFGYTEKEIIGKSADLIFTPEDIAVHAPQKEMETARDTGKAEDERWHIRKDGTRFYMSGVMAPIHDGDLTGYVKVARDMTEQQKAQENLRMLEERNRIALQSAEMASWDWYVDEDRITWNNQHYLLLGLQPDNKTKNTADFLQFIYEADIDKVSTALQRGVEETGIYHAEFRIIRADNKEVRWMNGFGRAVTQQGSHATRMIGVMFDITKRKKLEQQKEDFIGIASHELKTPVTSIKAYAELLQEMCEDGDTAGGASLVKKLNAQVDRLIELVHALLDITKMAEGELPLKIEQFNLKTLVEERAEDLQRLSNIHRIIIQPKKQIMVQADRERIGQVFTNLISNGIKYSPKGGAVTINWKQTKEGTEISVKDEGIGISEELQAKVFDRFFRANDVRVSTYPGMGLGLYITANIIQKHDGKIWVESKPGKGSTFYFMLPASQQ